MFISNFEKERITTRLKSLEARVEQLARSLNSLHEEKDAQAARNKALAALKTEEINKKAKQQIKRREYARTYYQRQKEKKLAAQAIPTL